MSSPVFAITASWSGPRWSSRPPASFAPPVPPERSTTKLVGQAGDPDSGVLDLVPRVDRDQQRGLLFEDARDLEVAAVHRPQSRDPPHELGDVVLGLAVVARDQDIFVELVRG